ncbi:MAG: hypothetical protein ACR2FY_05475 [Pirellulaceae bacterium]
MDENFENALSLVRTFVEGPWESYWKDLIGNGSRTGGCLIDVLRLKCPKQKQRDAISIDGQDAIRQRHPNLYKDKRTWEAKKWTENELRDVVQIVIDIAKIKGVTRDSQKAIQHGD